MRSSDFPPMSGLQDCLMPAFCGAKNISSQRARRDHSSNEKSRHESYFLFYHWPLTATAKSGELWNLSK